MSAISRKLRQLSTIFSPSGRLADRRPLHPANPGESTIVQWDAEYASQRFTVSHDLVLGLSEVLKSRGVLHRAFASAIILKDTELVLQPRLVSSEIQATGGVRLTTTIEVSHPTLFPEGVFEYQHTAGDRFTEALAKGFQDWAAIDFPVLSDLSLKSPEHCMALEIPVEPKDGRPALKRRVLLGPPWWVSREPQFPTTSSKTDDSDRDHGFCACCMYTHHSDAFKKLLESDAFCAVRVFAMRDDDGEESADCRVNGKPFEQGATALRQYITQWPNRGFEFRKQYLVFHTL